MFTIQTKLIQIGNSKGIRIPKILLDRLNITENIELNLIGTHLEIKALEDHPRSGWAEQFKKTEAPELLDSYIPLDGDELEWQW